MKKCFYVSSCIETDASPLSYAHTRSVFSSDERYRQTLLTVNTIKCLEPDATVYVLDASLNTDGYQNYFQWLFSQCIFVPMKQISRPEDFDRIRTHPNKSLGESIILRDFLFAYQHELRQYDYFFKMSGRYVINDGYDASYFDETRTHNLFFKEPLVFEWNDKWNWLKTDIRQEEGHNSFKQYCSVFYGYGKQQLDFFMNLYAGMAGILQHPDMMGYDMETFLYYFLRDYKSITCTLPVRVMGWEGPSGAHMRY